MGVESSKGIHNRSTVFNSGETDKLDTLFRSIAGDGGECVTLKQFKVFMLPRLPGEFSSKLYSYMKAVAETLVVDDIRNKKMPKKEEHISKNVFDASVGKIIKGNAVEKAKLLLCLIGDKSLEELKLLLNVFLHLAESSLSTSKEYLSWNFQPKFSGSQFISHFLFDLSIRDGRQQCDVVEVLLPESRFDVDDIERWLTRMPLLSHIMNLAFHQCFPVSDDVAKFVGLLPRCKDCIRAGDPVTILDLSSVIYINSTLPYMLRSEWRLLFSTILHGASFATMLKRIVNEGPTVFVIRDRGGHMFGSFAMESWSAHTNFFGSSQCFLFSLLPVMDVYLPTGYNSNFMYLNQNQQTLPNGLGMGGQWGYCGLWIDQEYGSGHSRAKPKCTTYNSPQLSSDPEFRFDFMEVWAVGPKASSQDGQEEGTGTRKKDGLLNMDVETKALLEMMGKRQHSEAIRQADAQADKTKPK